jgi:hypothetical protein
MTDTIALDFCFEHPAFADIGAAPQRRRAFAFQHDLIGTVSLFRIRP